LLSPRQAPLLALPCFALLCLALLCFVSSLSLTTSSLDLFKQAQRGLRALTFPPLRQQLLSAFATVKGQLRHKNGGPIQEGIRLAAADILVREATRSSLETCPVGKNNPDGGANGHFQGHGDGGYACRTAECRENVSVESSCCKCASLANVGKLMADKVPARVVNLLSSKQTSPFPSDRSIYVLRPGEHT
jgi:hypothetical protein